MCIHTHVLIYVFAYHNAQRRREYTHRHGNADPPEERNLQVPGRCVAGDEYEKRECSQVHRNEVLDGQFLPSDSNIHGVRYLVIRRLYEHSESSFVFVRRVA